MADSPFDLTGRRALVTGSTRGIGAAMAAGLARAGATVVLHGRDPSRVGQARDQLAAEVLARTSWVCSEQTLMILPWPRSSMPRASS